MLLLRRSKLFSVVVILFSVIIIFSLRYSIPHLDYKLLFYDDDDNFFEPKICEFPELNPFDPTILEYVKHPSPFHCEKIQPFLTFVDYDGFLRFNETEIALIQNTSIIDIKCYYKTFDRKPGSDDNALQYDEQKLLETPTKLAKDFVDVNCTAKNLNGEFMPNFYWNLHAHPSLREDNYFAHPTENQLSVLLMTIDSVSYSAFKRNMPLTYNYVINEMKMFMLESNA